MTKTQRTHLIALRDTGDVWAGKCWSASVQRMIDSLENSGLIGWSGQRLHSQRVVTALGIAALVE